MQPRPLFFILLWSLIVAEPGRAHDLSSILGDRWEANNLRAIYAYDYEEVPSPESMSRHELRALEWTLVSLEKMLHPTVIRALRPTIHRRTTPDEWDALRLRSNRAPSVDVYVNDYVFLFVVNKQPSNPPQNGQSRPFDVSAILDADAVFLPCIEITDFGTGRRLRTAARGMYGFRLYEPAGVQLEPERIFVALVDYGFTDTKSPPASPRQSLLDSTSLRARMRQPPVDSNLNLWVSDLGVAPTWSPMVIPQYWPEWFEGAKSGN